MRMFLLIASFGLCSPPAAASWPQFGGPTRDFRIAFPTITKHLVRWTIPIGPGKGGLATDGKSLYFQSSSPLEDKKSAIEITSAYEFGTGKRLWESKVEIRQAPKQETYGGDPIQPTSTPALASGHVVTLGYSGLIRCHRAETGKLVWETDLVKDHGALPVQYGFASSPLVLGETVIIHAGGKHALIAFRLTDGKVIWRSEPAEAGYASPILMTWKGTSYVVQLTRDFLFAIRPDDGTMAWRYDLPKKGLTNVPTPISLPNGGLLVSGQGLQGTRRLQLEDGTNGIVVKEIWYQRRIQFFYTNWLITGELVLGFPGNGGGRLTALKLSDGSIAYQELGQTDANLIGFGKELLLVRGDGVVSLGDEAMDGFVPARRGRPAAGRSWTPPSLVGSTALVRTDRELAAFPLSDLKEDFKAPADSGVSALDALYGGGSKKK